MKNRSGRGAADSQLGEGWPGIAQSEAAYAASAWNEEMDFLYRTIATSAPASVILIRLVVGGVFFLEGIQKFLYPAEVGAGRFAKIGIPSPEVMGPFVGVVETVCGALILLGLLTRWAAVPLIINMLVAILATKVPILLSQGFWGFSLRQVSYYGFWGMAHEMRTDWAMLLGSIFLLIVGAGSWSLDRRWQAKARATSGGGTSADTPHAGR